MSHLITSVIPCHFSHFSIDIKQWLFFFFLGHVSKQYGQRHSLTLTSVFLVASESWQILKSGSIHASFNSQFCDSSLGSTENLSRWRKPFPQTKLQHEPQLKLLPSGFEQTTFLLWGKNINHCGSIVGHLQAVFFFNRSQLLNCDFSNCPMTVLSLIAFLRRVPTSLESMFLPSFFITVDFF